MTNLPESLSRSLSLPFSPLAPQTEDLTSSTSFGDSFENFDSDNNPFSTVEGADSGLGTEPKLFLEQPECIDPSLLVIEYPDPLIASQLQCHPYPLAIPNNSEHPFPSGSSHLDTLCLPIQDYSPFSMEDMHQSDLADLWGQNDLNAQMTRSDFLTSDSRPKKAAVNSTLLNRPTSKKIVKCFSEINQFDPSNVYDAPPSVPPSFDKFRYTQFGELDPNISFTARNVERYLAHHPLNARRSVGDDVSGVTLWIQRNPADSRLRYHNQVSARCRFKDCPAVHKLISQGFYRIALDEHGVKGENYDPIGSNAGCFHLYCFEKFLDFPRICQEYNVQVDTRHLENEPNGRNRMKLGSKLEIAAAQRFLQSCKEGLIPSGYPDHAMINRPYENTLSHKLALEMYQDRGARALNQVQQRAGGENKPSHWTVHLLDLEVQATARALTRSAEGQIRKTPEERASQSIYQRILREPTETKHQTVMQIKKTFSHNSPKRQRQYEIPRRAKSFPVKTRPAETSTSLNLRSQRLQEHTPVPQEKKRVGRPPKRSREEQSQAPSSLCKLASRSRTTLTAKRPIRPLQSGLPSKRLRSCASKVNYVEPDTDVESEVDEEPVRASKRRCTRPNYAEFSSGLPMGDTIVVQC